MIVGERERDRDLVFREQVTVGARQIRFKILDCEVNTAISGCVEIMYWVVTTMKSRL